MKGEKTLEKRINNFLLARILFSLLCGFLAIVMARQVKPVYASENVTIYHEYNDWYAGNIVIPKSIINGDYWCVVFPYNYGGNASYTYVYMGYSSEPIIANNVSTHEYQYNTSMYRTIKLTKTGYSIYDYETAGIIYADAGTVITNHDIYDSNGNLLFERNYDDEITYSDYVAFRTTALDGISYSYSGNDIANDTEWNRSKSWYFDKDVKYYYNMNTEENYPELCAYASEETSYIYQNSEDENNIIYESGTFTGTLSLEPWMYYTDYTYHQKQIDITSCNCAETIYKSYESMESSTNISDNIPNVEIIGIDKVTNGAFGDIEYKLRYNRIENTDMEMVVRVYYRIPKPKTMLYIQSLEHSNLDELLEYPERRYNGYYGQWDLFYYEEVVENLNGSHYFDLDDYLAENTTFLTEYYENNNSVLKSKTVAYPEYIQAYYRGTIDGITERGKTTVAYCKQWYIGIQDDVYNEASYQFVLENTREYTDGEIVQERQNALTEYYMNKYKDPYNIDIEYDNNTLDAQLNNVKGIIGYITAIPSIISSLFSFIPVEIRTIIGFAITFIAFFIIFKAIRG